MTTKWAVLSTAGVLVACMIVVGIACSGMVSSGASEAEVGRRASQLGTGVGTLMVILLAPVWIWWAQARRNAKLKAEEDARRLRKKRRRAIEEVQDDAEEERKPRKRRDG